VRPHGLPLAGGGHWITTRADSIDGVSLGCYQVVPAGGVWRCTLMFHVEHFAASTVCCGVSRRLGMAFELSG
jgi:hypothetical protein